MTVKDKALCGYSHFLSLHGKFTMNSILLSLLAFVVSVKVNHANEITVRKYEKVDNIILEDYVLSKVDNNASSKLKCASLCAEQKCACVSYFFEKTTKTCRMYADRFTTKLPGGEVTAYVDRSECVRMPPPSFPDTAVVWSCVGDVATATYTCNPDLYSTIGNPAISCPWSTGQWSVVQFQCQDAWVCYYYTTSDVDQIEAGVDEKHVCEVNGRRLINGDVTRLPGCLSECTCCQRV